MTCRIIAPRVAGERSLDSWRECGRPSAGRVVRGCGGRSAVDRLVVVEELLAAGAPVGYHWIAEFGDETSLNLRLGAAMADSGGIIAAATSVASTVGV